MRIYQNFSLYVFLSDCLHIPQFLKLITWKKCCAVSFLYSNLIPNKPLAKLSVISLSFLRGPECENTEAYMIPVYIISQIVIKF